MPVKMKAEQLAFWQELLAPFAPEDLSIKKQGGKDLTFVDKRAIMNRLDSVVDPVRAHRHSRPHPPGRPGLESGAWGRSAAPGPIRRRKRQALSSIRTAHVRDRTGA